MGCGGNHQHSCEEIFVAILLRIDHELIDPNLELALTQHCDECPPCLETLAAHESNVRLIKQLLGNTCREEAQSHCMSVSSLRSKNRQMRWRWQQVASHRPSHRPLCSDRSRVMAKSPLKFLTHRSFAKVFNASYLVS